MSFASSHVFLVFLGSTSGLDVWHWVSGPGPPSGCLAVALWPIFESHGTRAESRLVERCASRYVATPRYSALLQAVWIDAGSVAEGDTENKDILCESEVVVNAEISDATEEAQMK